MIDVGRLRTAAKDLIRTSLRPEERARIERLSFNDEGHGYDRLGLSPDWVAGGLMSTRFLYERYFRVTAHGAEHIPSSGAAILAANHSGMLPLDAVMLYVDIFENTEPPRVPRFVLDFFVPRLPFVSTFFARTGATSGTRATVRRLLDDGELLVVFPEGTPGIGKPFRDRYHLAEWRVGHAELAIRHRAPVVPVAIIGAEEQWIQATRLEWFHLFGAPFLPLPLNPIPLPVHYHIWYGEPIALHEQYAPDRADDPEVCAKGAAVVRAAVEALIDRGLRERRGIFA